MRAATSCAALALLLALPSTAAASHHRRHHHAHIAAVVRYDPAQAAYTIAARYWGVVPCAGHVTVVDAPPPANDEASAGPVMMWSSWDMGSQWENREDAPQPFSSCVVGINSRFWLTRELAAFNLWPEFAISFVHEFGHLLGHGHSTDPASPMYPEPSANEALTGSYAPGWASPE